MFFSIVLSGLFLRTVFFIRFAQVRCERFATVRFLLVRLAFFTRPLPLRIRTPGGLKDPRDITINPLPFWPSLLLSLYDLDRAVVTTSLAIFLAAAFRCGFAILKPLFNRGRAVLKRALKIPPIPDPYITGLPAYPGNPLPAWFR